jgi:CHAD domain-containing protein
MPLDPDQLEKPLRKLRKSIRKITNKPSPEEVHDIRTSTRRTEATLHALLLDNKRRGRRVLKTVTPVRKRAGKVRDMDVLTGFATTLSSDGEKECLVQLLEHLGQQRLKGARKLRRTASKRRQVAGRLLRRCSRFIDRNLNGTRKRPPRSEWSADAAAVALQLSGELAAWPKLNAENLHPFRLKVKELRYVLQLSRDSSDAFVEALGEVKDAIGEWHDWMELSAIADDLLSHDACNILEQLKTTTKQRFDKALKLANQLRDTYLSSPAPKKKQSSASLPINERVLKSASKLAA